MPPKAAAPALSSVHPNAVQTRTRKRKTPANAPSVAQPDSASSSFRERPVAEWTTGEVAMWCLSTAGIAEMGLRLKKANITGAQLLTIDAANVNAVCRLRGQAGKRLVEAVSELKEENDEATASSTRGAPKRKCAAKTEAIAGLVSVVNKVTKKPTPQPDPAFQVHKDPAEAPEGSVSNPVALDCEESADTVESVGGVSERGALVSADDPEVEYDEELYSWMLQRETLPNLRPNLTYMKWHPSLNEKMRSILLDWIMEVCREFEMQRETFHLAVNIVDRFLSCVSEVHKNRLQLVGVASLFVAAKVEEVYPPKATEFAAITDGAFTILEIYKMERLVLRKMDWDVIAVTPCWWASTMVHRIHAATGYRAASETRQAKYRLVMGLVDLSSLGYASMKFMPSQIAAAAVHLTLGADHFLLEQVTGMEIGGILPCIKWMAGFLPILRQDRGHWCAKDNLYRNLTCEADVHTVQSHDPDLLGKLRTKVWGQPPAPAIAPYN